MKKWKTGLPVMALILIGILVGFFIGMRFTGRSTPDDISFSGDMHLPKADGKIFLAAVKTVTDYQSNLPWVEKCTVKAEPEVGEVETDWYPVNEGDVSEKVQVLVWADHFRVDVWHRVRRGGVKTPFKSEISRVVERRLQENLEEALKPGPVR